MHSFATKFDKNRDFWYFYGTNEMSQNYFSRSFRDILSVMESNNLNLSGVFTKVNVGKKRRNLNRKISFGK